MDVRTGVPLFTTAAQTEDEQIEQLLQELLVAENLNDGQADLIDNADPPLQWPTQNTNPVNEYTTQGYVTMVFPCLFPSGKADLRNESQRQIKLGTAEYFETLLRYKDGRFGSHPRLDPNASNTKLF